MARWLPCILALTMSVAAALAAGPTEMRTWYDNKGTQFYGRALELNGSDVLFEGADGSRVTVGLSELSRQDALLVQEHFGVASTEHDETTSPDSLAEDDPDAPLSTPVMALIVIGFIVCLIGGLWFLITAFQEGIGWGLGCILVPFVSLIFLIAHWDDAKKPFVVQLAGLAFIIVALVLDPDLRHRFPVR